MSIATKTGDKGKTALIGGERVSKADFRVETYGTIDELGAAMGFARSICGDAEVDELTKKIQRELFLVAGSVANPKFEEAPNPYVTPDMIDHLSDEVSRIEKMEGILSDWSLPGDVSSAAAYDIARTICRRAERIMVELAAQPEEPVSDAGIQYMNRLSDFLFVASRSQNDNGAGDVLWVPGQNR